MMPTLQPEAEPQLETPRWTLCTLLPIVVDGALIVLAVLVLLYLIMTMRQKQDARMRTAVDIMLAVALLLLIAQYIVCDTFLPLEYLIFLLLTVFAVLLRVADYLGQKKVKPVITPRKPWSQSFRDVEHKLESLKPTLPKLEKPSWFALPKLPQRTSPQPKLKEKASLLKRIDASLTRAFTPKPKPQPNKLPKPVAPKLLPQPKAPKPAPLPQTKPLKKLFSFAPQPKAQVSAPEPRASTRDLKDILAAVHQSEKLLERYSRTTKRFKKK
jgi:Ca2+/Na+ antiporter